MKNALIGSLVAAVIIFLYQFLSWTVLGIHDTSLKYTPQQEAIAAALSENLTERGMYAIPNLAPGSSREQHEAFEQSMVGKPWAIVQYDPQYGGMMSSQMVYGFILNLVAAFAIAYVMSAGGEKFASFGSKLMLVVGFIVFLVFQSSLMMANWWETPWHYLSGEITDHVVGWLLGGIWLSWWMGRQQKATA
ncbi:hypothetical protein FBQ87_13115 [Sphingobacteriales bacterium CHB3]|nr:hypothetical protein [Sphingobacteriales bacterium CHB3]